KSMILRWNSTVSGVVNELKRSYEYYPDWLLKRTITADGNFDFAYQRNGALTAWTTARKQLNTMAFDERGEVSAVRALRSDGVTEFLNWAQTAVPAGMNGEGKEFQSFLTHTHTAEEEPDNGTTAYTSTTQYDSAGRPSSIDRSHSGNISGSAVSRSL